jgi:hypothetical protein
LFQIEEVLDSPSCCGVFLACWNIWRLGMQLYLSITDPDMQLGVGLLFMMSHAHRMKADHKEKLLSWVATLIFLLVWLLHVARYWDGSKETKERCLLCTKRLRFTLAVDFSSWPLKCQYNTHSSYTHHDIKIDINIFQKEYKHCHVATNILNSGTNMHAWGVAAILPCAGTYRACPTFSLLLCFGE